jgi:hypothetical protein
LLELVAATPKKRTPVLEREPAVFQLAEISPTCLPKVWPR